MKRYIFVTPNGNIPVDAYNRDEAWEMFLKNGNLESDVIEIR